MAVVHVSKARLGETRAAVAQELGERFAPGGSVPILSTREMRLVSEIGYVAQMSPGVFAFDWSLVQETIGRYLTPLDHRVLRESAIGSAVDRVDERLAALAATIDAVMG
jgi:hypothetical protein